MREYLGSTSDFAENGMSNIHGSMIPAGSVLYIFRVRGKTEGGEWGLYTSSVVDGQDKPYEGSWLGVPSMGTGLQCGIHRITQDLDWVKIKQIRPHTGEGKICFQIFKDTPASE